MNIDRKKAILLKLKSKGFHISQQVENNFISSFEEFYQKRIGEKEKIINELKEIKNKIEEKKIPTVNENLLLEHKIVSVKIAKLLNLNSLN